MSKDSPEILAAKINRNGLLIAAAITAFASLLAAGFFLRPDDHSTEASATGSRAGDSETTAKTEAAESGVEHARKVEPKPELTGQSVEKEKSALPTKVAV